MSETDWIGQMLNGRYQIQELIGQGGMSAVYKANDPNLRRVVAIKLIHPHLSEDPEFVRRFEKEAAAVAQLRHPNLIQVYDFNKDDEAYYIVFEFLPGETLQERLKRLKMARRQMDIGEVVNITAKSAEGLHYAHQKGLIHRDIKPANIMINVQGSPIIMDFGIAKIMGGTLHTATGAVLGTARYMSPEQIKGERVDPRTDLYSLGVTLFAMLAAHPPFEADSAMSLMMMHMSDPVPDLTKIRTDISPELAAVVTKSLAKEPGARYQTGIEFASALRDAGESSAAASPIMATIVSSAPPKPAPPPAVEAAPIPAAADPYTPAATASAAAGTVSAATEPPRTPPPTASAPPPTASSGGSRSLLFGVGAVIILLLLAIGVWAVFFRDGDDGGNVAGGGAVQATATSEQPPTPDREATKAAVDAEMAAQIETRVAEAKLQTAEAAAAPPTIMPTRETPPEENVAGAFGVEITNIVLENGVYNVFYLTSGYTEELPGRHVHFYFDTVPEIEAGAQGGDGSGWKRYGGPRPFSGYTEADRPAEATSMCARAANENHTIILDSGNCYPLP